MVQPPWKTLWQFVKKLNIFLTYNPANALLGIDPNGAETYVHTKILSKDIYRNFIYKLTKLVSNQDILQ